MSSYARAYDIRQRGGIAHKARKLSHAGGRGSLPKWDEKPFFGKPILISAPDSMEKKPLYDRDAGRSKPNMRVLDSLRDFVREFTDAGLAQEGAVSFEVPGRFARPAALEAVVLGIIEALRRQRRRAMIEVDKVPRRRYYGGGSVSVLITDNPFGAMAAPAAIVVNKSLVPIDIPLRSALLVPKPKYYPKKINKKADF